MQSPELTAFKEQLLLLSNELTGDQLKQMVFVSPIGKAQKEKITKGYELFDALIQREVISPDNTEYLSTLLTEVGRSDLAAKLKTFSKSNYGASMVPSEPRGAESAKIDLAAEVIADNLGTNWRKLGRKLGLSEVKLQNIGRKQLDLEEITMEVIWEWRRAQGSEACVKQLLVALRKCDLKLTAEKVEEELLNMGHHELNIS